MIDFAAFFGTMETIKI